MYDIEVENSEDAGVPERVGIDGSFRREDHDMGVAARIDSVSVAPRIISLFIKLRW